jgi:hypothetical protein
VLVSWLTTTDHKRIGHLYLITSFGFFLVAGVPAMLVRAELARPVLQLLSHEQYNQAFTMHGTIMLLLFATPTFAGFANAVMPLQIGAPDVAFPGPRTPMTTTPRGLGAPVRLADTAGAASRRCRGERPQEGYSPLPRGSGPAGSGEYSRTGARRCPRPPTTVCGSTSSATPPCCSGTGD